MLTDKELEEIRRKMQELDEEPPADAWPKIRADIQPKRRWRFLWWIMGGLLLSTALGIYWINRETQHPDLQTTRENRQSPAATGREEGEVITALPPERVQGKSDHSTDPRSNSTTQAMPSRQSKQLEPALEDNATEALTPETRPTTQLPDRIGGQKERQYPLKNQARAHQKQRRPKSKRPTGTTDDQSFTAKPNHIPERVTPVSEVNEKERSTRTREVTAAPVAGLNPLPGKGISAEAVRLPIQLDSVHITVRVDSAALAKNVPEADNKRTENPKEWTLGAFVAPRYSFLTVKPTHSDEILITQLNVNQANTERMGYEAGINFSRSLTPNWYLEASLYWVQLKEDVAYSFTNGEVDTLIRSLTSDGKIDVKPVYVVGQRQLTSSYAYGGLRIGATRYFWQTGRHRYSLTMGAGANLLVKGRTQEILNGESLPVIVFPAKDNILEQSNYNLLIGIGYNTRVSKGFELTVMPTLNYFLGSTFRAREPLGLRPYSLGLHLQIRRNFLLPK